MLVALAVVYYVPIASAATIVIAAIAVAWVVLRKRARR
jgi:hypothetical protein